MTVAELIQALSHYERDLPVLVAGEDRLLTISQAALGTALGLPCCVALVATPSEMRRARQKAEAQG